MSSGKPASLSTPNKELRGALETIEQLWYISFSFILRRDLMGLYIRQIWREPTRGKDQLFEKEFEAGNDEEAVRLAQETAERFNSQDPFTSMGLSRVFSIVDGHRSLIFWRTRRNA